MQVHVWNTEKLLEKISSGRIRPWDELTYFFLFFGFSSSYLHPIIFSNIKSYAAKPLHSAISDAVIATVGVFFCFWMNRSGDGKDFISRFVYLSVNTFLRGVAVYVLLALIFIIGPGVVFKLDLTQRTLLISLIDISVRALFGLYWFGRIGGLMKYLSKGESAVSNRNT